MTTSNVDSTNTPWPNRTPGTTPNTLSNRRMSENGSTSEQDSAPMDQEAPAATQWQPGLDSAPLDSASVASSSTSAQATATRVDRVSARVGMMKEKMMNMRRHDRDYELIAAALFGAAAGVLATILLRQSASGRRPIMNGLHLAGRGMQKAGKAGLIGAAATGRTIARNAKRGAEMVEEIPFGDIADHVRDYFDAAKGAVEDTISDELHDLKKSIRRRRRRLGI